MIPNWTPATVFPAADAGVSFTATTAPPTYTTLIRVPDVSASGTNLPYTEYYFSSGSWRRVVGNAVADDDTLLPDSHFVVRNINGAPTLPLVNLGGVLLKKVTTPLVTSNSTQQDNPVGILRPLDVALNATGLKMSDGSFGPSDQLLLFNNAVAGFDKLPSAIYVQTAAANGPWRLSTDPVNDRGNDIIPAGVGFIVRKGVGNGQPDFWTNNFPVQAISAVSRKTHGGAGDFDIDLPLSGPPAVECRLSSSYKVIFTFPTVVTLSGAAVTSGTATMVTPSGSATNVVTVDLAGVTDTPAVTITLLDVDDGTNTNNVAVRMRVLSGDTNGSGSVSAADVAQVKAQSGAVTTTANFRLDVNASGAISASDVALVKSKSGSSVPAGPGDEVQETRTAAAR